eukprot:7377660-Prymnesium_polylepis.1
MIARNVLTPSESGSNGSPEHARKSTTSSCVFESNVNAGSLVAAAGAASPVAIVVTRCEPRIARNLTNCGGQIAATSGAARRSCVRSRSCCCCCSALAAACRRSAACRSAGRRTTLVQALPVCSRESPKC